MEEYVLDTSVLVAAILGTSSYEHLVKCKGRYYVPDYVLRELIRKSDEIALEIARRGEDVVNVAKELLTRLITLYQRLTLVSLTDVVDEEAVEVARRIIGWRDPKDIPILALAIALRRGRKRVHIVSFDKDVLEEAPKHGIPALKRPRCCREH